MQVEYEFHELATLFPRMEDKAFSDLVEDIRKNGLREPIVRYKEKILDGRNRYLACLAAGVEPRFVEYDGSDPVGFVISANLHRRHLTESQMGSLVVKLGAYGVGRPAKAMAKAEEVAALRASDEALTQAKIAKKAGVSPQSVGQILKPGKISTKSPPNGGVSVEKLSKINISAKDAATLGSVGTRTIERCRAVHSTGNDRLIEALDNGSLSADKAASIASKSPEYVEAVLDSINAGAKPAEAIRQAHKSLLPNKIAALPEGKYRVIYADPPWAYNDARQTGDHRETTGVDAHYASMPLADIKALDVKDLAADDSVLLLWATFPLLREAFDVADAWGFKYKTSFVWNKGHGCFGHYHDAEAELLFICTRGSCLPEVDEKQKQIQAFPRGRHSAKPEAWRQLIDTLWPSGPRIELFHRGSPPDGWKTWGGQSDA